MDTSKNTQGSRIIIAAMLIGLFIVGATVYQSYAEDVKQKVSETVVEMLPDLDHGLAQL